MRKHELLQALEGFSDEIQIFVPDSTPGITCMFGVEYRPPEGHAPGRLILKRETT